MELNLFFALLLILQVSYIQFFKYTVMIFMNNDIFFYSLLIFEGRNVFVPDFLFNYISHESKFSTANKCPLEDFQTQAAFAGQCFLMCVVCVDCHQPQLCDNWITGLLMV